MSEHIHTPDCYAHGCSDGMPEPLRDQIEHAEQSILSDLRYLGEADPGNLLVRQMRLARAIMDTTQAMPYTACYHRAIALATVKAYPDNVWILTAPQYPLKGRLDVMSSRVFTTHAAAVKRRSGIVDLLVERFLLHEPLRSDTHD